MKYFSLLLFMAIGSAGISQSLAPGHMQSILHNSNQGSERESIIWSEDFANGIPADWTNEDEGDIAYWEYRGPSTIPDNSVGSRGQCTDQSAPGNVIESPTVENGFVIFDSNWWDNPNLPCSVANFGTGPAPAPHVATLTTSPIDLSASPDVAIRFNQFLRNYQAEMRVECSANGGPWLPVYINTVADLSPNDMQVQIPVSLIAGGQPNVKFRFVFQGTYYHWQLDDICVVEILPNDLAISESTFGDFDFFDISHPTGFELMEYTMYPEELAPLLKFSTQCENIGSNTMNDCRLNIDVSNFLTSQVLHSAQSAEGFAIMPGESMELRAGTFQMPATVGDYQVHFFTSQTENDDNPANHVHTSGFRITDCTYARDHGFTSAVFIPGLDVASLDYEIGNVFLMTAPNQSCLSISAAIAAGTALPSDIYARIYEFEAQSQINATIIATTNNYAITPDEINQYGGANFMHLMFDTPVPLQQGHAYLAVIGSDDGADNVYVAFSGQSPEYTSWVHFLPEQWFYLTGTPMVRMNFCTNIGVEEGSETNEQVSMFPNPVADYLNLHLPDMLHQKVQIAIYDFSGKLLYEENITKLAETVHKLDTSMLGSGVYCMKVSGDKNVLQGRFVKQ